ncbi:hypothetical protein [Pseudoduganella namucuonensis]|uniref:Uncharacterized protein n=1 Tax=Pseudoduganella namucuonensis TaxID=1035707 RepID=A0A1I7F0C1_9BURK|nr:hypothetical protein [Pseudoduganella namucuonensis]SFU29632.1 hypothetical protein SAMN05216552_1001289 [Pseudoduganella namucuonensis]
MTQESSQDPEQCTLSVSFDAQQLSSQLNWQFEPNSLPWYGGNAGAILFNPKEQLSVEILAFGSKASGFDGFKVIECAILTRPQITRLTPGEAVRFASPSPFDGATGACVLMEGFSPEPALGQSAFAERLRQPGYSMYGLQSDGFLTVAKAPGRWDLSFYLTVELAFAGREPVRRVYYFDPESEVGDGGHPTDGGGRRTQPRK